VAERLETLGLVPWGDPLELSSVEVTRLLGAASHTGLVALLGAALDLGAIVSAAEVERADDVTASVRQVWTDRLTVVVAHDVLLVDAVTHLERHGIPTRALKGAALAHLDEFDPSWRTYGDADVLVPHDRLMDAVDALGDLGLVPLLPPVRRGWADRFAKGVTLRADDGRHLDLHRTLAAGPLGERLDSSALFADGTPFDVGGATIVALAEANRFAHACYHAALSATCSHRHRRDVALLAAKVQPSDLRLVARVGWSTTVICAAIDSVASTGATPSDWVEWSAGTARSPDDERLLVAARASFATAAKVAVRNRRGPVDATRYLSGLIWPQRAHLQARGLTRGQHLSGLLRSRP
jgi:hypothetical protein